MNYDSKASIIILFLWIIFSYYSDSDWITRISAAKFPNCVLFTNRFRWNFAKRFLGSKQSNVPTKFLRICSKKPPLNILIDDWRTCIFILSSNGTLCYMLPKSSSCDNPSSDGVSKYRLEWVMGLCLCVCTRGRRRVLVAKSSPNTDPWFFDPARKPGLRAGFRVSKFSGPGSGFWNFFPGSGPGSGFHFKIFRVPEPGTRPAPTPGFYRLFYSFCRITTYRAEFWSHLRSSHLGFESEISYYFFDSISHVLGSRT